MAFKLKNPPEFTIEVEQWTKRTEADGEEMAKSIGKLLNNDVYLKEQIERKVTAAGGDISDTKISRLEESEESYPVPEQGNSIKVILGKLVKFCNDVKTGCCKIADIADNCTSTDTNKPLAAKQGKVLWEKIELLSKAATQTASGLMSAADKKKLDGVANSANNYSHPASHGASMITQDGTHRFATDAEKKTWNEKCRVLNTGWGQTLTIPYGRGIHGIVLLAQNNVYFVWVGGNAPNRNVNVTKISSGDGDDDINTASFSYNNSNNTLTCKTNSTISPTTCITYIGL